jgi:transcriptional regulator of nitric oxide reductase
MLWDQLPCLAGVKILDNLCSLLLWGIPHQTLHLFAHIIMAPTKKRKASALEEDATLVEKGIRVQALTAA